MGWGRSAPSPAARMRLQDSHGIWLSTTSTGLDSPTWPQPIEQATTSPSDSPCVTDHLGRQDPIQQLPSSAGAKEGHRRCEGGQCLGGTMSEAATAGTYREAS